MQDAAKLQFESDPEITEAVEAVMAIVGERGSTVPWEAIEVAAKCRRYTGSWSTIVNNVRKRLRKERMQVTRTEVSIGLYLLTHKEAVVEIPKRRQLKMYRQSTRQLQEMQAIDLSALSDGERRLHAHQVHIVKTERRSFLSARKAVLSAFEALPQRPSIS